MTRRLFTCVRYPLTILLPAVFLIAMAAPAAAQSLPGGWSARDIGSVGASGSASGSGTSFQLRGAGADIWGSADGFQYAYRTLSGDGEIVAYVSSLDYLHPWSKAGVMMRESLSADSKHAYALVSAGQGTAFQRRAYSGSSSTHTAASGGRYVRLIRSGNSFDAYTSWDGSSWHWVDSQTISMASTIYVGLAVTSHYYGALAGASFTSVSVTESGGSSAPVADTSSSSSGLLPSGWAAQDLGGVAARGYAQGSGGEFTITGSGEDIWDYADEFQFAYTTLTGDGSIVTRVTHVDYSHAWSKAGVMMRESLSAGSSHAYMLISAAKGMAFQRRTYAGGASTSTNVGWGSAPYYVKLQRSGSTFAAYYSSDGSSWTLVDTTSISMGSTIYVGLAVTSHADGTLSNGYFSGTSVSAGAEPVAAAPAPAPEPAPQPGSSYGTGGSLRVLHWNVHHLIGTDGVFDPNRIAWWIAQMRPDIISLNEIDDAWQAELITRAIGSATGQGWNTAYSGWGNLILSRFAHNGSSVCHFNPSYGRLAAHMSTSVNGRTINIWSAHLGLESSGTRLYEVSNLQSCASAWSEARIVAGDYNMQASSSEYAAMASSYTDGWAAARSLGTTSNYSGNCDGCTRNSRIDYVFSSQNAWFLRVASAEIIDTRDGYGYMPSDHKPLVVTYYVD